MIKSFEKSLDPEAAFLSGLLDLQYGLKVTDKLSRLAPHVSWAKGWPHNLQAFWNAEAFMWSRKIEKQHRDLIAKELGILKTGKNLDLGCGAYSYIPSVGFDVSPKMLDFNEQCYAKVIGDLEKKLPFKNQEFASATAIFVLNYILNYQLLLPEIKRVLAPKGIFVAVLYNGEINDWQRQKEVNTFGKKEWKKILEEHGFKVKISEKAKLLFFHCFNCS
ncbi:class I SAM-dependent methyltransferase [Candidatus Woesearchaeota archaeon]|nr:class I SAM-dependent methyltransferase [Candidatus Woesearchaeota archaeon]